jgi:preprotein translocase subunit SecE
MSSISKENDKSSFVGELLQVGLYKPNQGRMVRQVTFLSIAILVCLIAYEFYNSTWTSTPTGRFTLASAVAAIGFWFAYRVVNYTKFADFLISVQAELNKVTWPSREQLKRASFVVIFVIFFMALVLYVFDLFWTILFQIIGIRY